MKKEKIEPVKTYIAEVVGNRKFSEDNFLLELKMPKGLVFKGGQFIMAHNNKEERPFSIASPPSQDSIELLIKKQENGAVSPFLYGLKKGDKLKISGPYGTFTVKKTLNKELVFIGAGTGVAPLRSMVSDALKDGGKKITLIFGFRTDFFFKDIFEKLQKKHKNFKLHACSSKPTKKWKGLCGRATNHLKKLIKSSEGKDVYVCGPSAMVKDTLKILKELGFGKSQIHTEKWV